MSVASVPDDMLQPGAALKVSPAEAFAPTPPSPPSDATPLFARVAAGDQAALRALYDRHAPQAMAVAMRILRAPNEAEEIVQETFVEVWRRAAEYDGRRGGATTWIVAIARNRAIDRLRARGTIDRTQRAAADEPLARTAPTPLEDVEDRQRRARVATALAVLPVEQRRCIELAYFEGLSHGEIAARTGDPLGTVKTRMRLGMDKLAALLDDSDGSAE